MNLRMKNQALFLCLFFGVCTFASAQQNDKTLPSAPSSAISPRPAPVSEPTQKEAKPATGTPALESLEKKPQRQPVAPLEPPKDSAIEEKKKTADKAVEAKAKEDEELTKIVKRVEEVNVIFTVTDKRGRFIKDLKQDDFRILDDKRPAEAIRNFSAETNLPIRVGLLIDASNSIRTQFKFEQEAAIEFLNQIVRPKADKAFILAFDSNTELTQDFTNSTEDLSKAIRSIRPGGGTAMWDAIYFACRDKLLDTKDKETVRRAIILLSDGQDNQSRVFQTEAVEMAQRAGVIIYTISTSLSPDKNSGDKILEKVAEATGGRAFFPFKIQDVADAFSDIQDELRSQYVLAYKPAEFLADGRYRSIDISAPNKKFKVRARKGYFAPRQ